MMKSFIQGFKHAFAVGPAPDVAPVLPPILERFAAAVTSKGLEIPVLVVLETVSPLNFLASQAAAAFAPLLSGFMDTSELEEAASALEDRTVVRRLAARIEQLAQDAELSC